MQEDGLATERNSSSGAEIFEYLDCPGVPPVQSLGAWDETAESVNYSEGSKASDATNRAEEALPVDFNRQLAEESRASFEAGRVRGIEEGRTAEREAQAEMLAAARERTARQSSELLEDFAKQRERYFHAAEQEIVRLALAVAARILRREAAIDPLLLLGAVRAALGQVADSAEVRVRVPAAELALWAEAIALLPNLAERPTVLAGEGMQTGECRIETALGSADLSLRSQLGEVERVLLGNSHEGKRKPPASCSAPAAMHAENVA